MPNRWHYFVQQLQEQVMNEELSQGQLRKKNNRLREESLQVVSVTVQQCILLLLFILCPCEGTAALLIAKPELPISDNIFQARS